MLSSGEWFLVMLSSDGAFLDVLDVFRLQAATLRQVGAASPHKSQAFVAAARHRIRFSLGRCLMCWLFRLQFWILLFFHVFCNVGLVFVFRLSYFGGLLICICMWCTTVMYQVTINACVGFWFALVWQCVTGVQLFLLSKFSGCFGGETGGRTPPRLVKGNETNGIHELSLSTSL